MVERIRRRVTQEAIPAGLRRWFEGGEVALQFLVDGPDAAVRHYFEKWRREDPRRRHARLEDLPGVPPWMTRAADR